jgi:hypothetical protein
MLHLSAHQERSINHIAVRTETPEKEAEQYA